MSLWKYCKKTRTPSDTDWCYENKLCGEDTWAEHYPVSLPVIL